MPNTGTHLATLLPPLVPRLRAFALRLSGDPHDAEDLVQLACVRALERAHQLKPGSSPLSWTFSIVHSIWINEVRSRQVRGRACVEWDDSTIDAIRDPAAHPPECALMHAQLLEALYRLPERQREVMLRVAIERFSYRETAEQLGIPIGTVMSRISRARQTLGALHEEPPSAAARARPPSAR
ncbi:RNA polymerase sigma factor [Pseudomonas sp. NPDC089401]|uniref:RNA polymerase sigma factor n=1 Tax=Pseudomonas sp. NPDC089401 TaxID=3364462 RepID=UPI0037FDDEED